MGSSLMNTVLLPKILQPFRCESLIRLGKSHDGGYLVNSLDLNKTENLVSFGIGEDSSFEQDFLRKSISNCYSYDQSVRPDVLEKFKISHCQKNIGNQIGEQSTSQVFEGLDKIFLKCDIESNEYDILNDLIQFSNRFTGIVIEFHDIATSNKFEVLSNFIAKIDQKLVHTHINNYMYYKTPNGIIPDVLELTFTGSKNINFDPELRLPHILDMSNDHNIEDFKIIFN
jgi:hypothetical protein